MNHTKCTYTSVFATLLTILGMLQFSMAQQQVNTAFRDDFVGKTLNPVWQIIAPDKDRLSLIDNEYLIIVTTKKGVNLMQYSSELSGDYEITLKVQTPPLYAGQVIRLLIRRDDDNNIRLAYTMEYDNEPELDFEKRLRGEESTIRSKTKPSKDGPFYLKLSKDGVEYKGAYSPDGLTWVSIGTHVFLNLRGGPAFEAYNSPPSTYIREVPESGIRFDYFEIKASK